MTMCCIVPVYLSLVYELRIGKDDGHGLIATWLWMGCLAGACYRKWVCHGLFSSLVGEWSSQLWPCQVFQSSSGICVTQTLLKF